MKIIRKIALAELQSFFYSPIAWIIIIIFAVMAFMGFMDIIGQFLRAQEMNYADGNLTIQILGGPRGFFSNVTQYLYLYIPLLTMGLMSRELSSGSIKLLYSSPVFNGQIIFGKYLAMMAYGLVMVAVLLIPILYGAATVDNFDWPIALVGLLGIYLLICIYSAIGLFMSSLMSYQIVAAIGTFAVLFVLNNVSRVGQSIDFIRDITYWLNLGGRANSFYVGLISSENLLYFILVIALFLSLSILRLKAIRQKAKGSVVWGKYAVAVAAVFMLGYVTTRPAMKLYYDSTRTKQLTLTENSQSIIAQAEGPLKITTYVNVLENNFYNGLPQSRNWDLQRFEQYMRFKPEIKMKYVYYYAKPDGSDLDQRFPGLTDEQMVGRISTSYNIDSTMFKPLSTLPENIQASLKGENYRFVRIMERGNGQTTFLRIFDDIMRHPSEREISAALKRIVMELPVVGFVGGHGERNINTEGDRGYSNFSHDKPFRNALVNQGFNVEEVTLDSPIPAHINIIVIADMRTAMTPSQEANLDAYIARGGNLLVAGERNRQQTMNPVIAKFGARFLPGQIVRRSGAGEEARMKALGVMKPLELEVSAVDSTKKTTTGGATLTASATVMNFSGGDGKLFWGQGKEDDHLPDFVVGNVTEDADRLAYGFGVMHNRKQVVTMPGCLAIEYDTDKGFSVTPLLMGDEKDSWNELETTNFVDDIPTIDAAMGEKEQSLPMGIALSRNINGREQKVLVLGDADCISNGEISIGRNKVNARNYDMIMATFFWLSDQEVPIDIRRPDPTDNTLDTDTKSLRTMKILMIGLLPALLLAASIIILLRRKGR